MQDSDVDPSVSKENASLACFGPAEIRELHILPTSKEVLGVPVRLAVAKED
jgi:hypothetical protein